MGNLEVEMRSPRQFSRISTAELKSQIMKKLGKEKAEKYFLHLKRLLGLKISKLEFDKLCYNTIGRENIGLHNLFIRSILKNACLAHSSPAKKTNTGQSPNSTISNGYLGETFLTSPRKERSVNSRFRKFRDRPSPLGPYGKVHGGSVQDISNSCDLQRPQELISIGSKALLEVGSVEDGEEVEQVRGSPGVQSRSPVRAPLGISMNSCSISRKHFRMGLGSGCHRPFSDSLETCYNSAELPDTGTLKKRLECKLELEGLGLSAECVNLLNGGLDAYLKRLIKPCMELARARCNGEWRNPVSVRLVPGINGTWKKELVQRPKQSCSASLLDFRVAMELNPQLLGEEWPMQLEKISLRGLEE